jgi:D-sedoheptulose 7-phosphate isomerase
MNHIDQLYTNSVDIGNFAKGYLDYLKKVFDNLEIASIIQLEEELEEARKNENTIFIAGNGGSATTATTMANDLGFDIIKKTETDKPFRMLALTDNNGVMTAIANDVGYENIFINQMKIHYRTGDMLIAISASGNSPNVIKAAEWIKSKGGRVAGLLGFDGGRLKGICDIAVCVPTVAGEYGPVEDVHLIMNHILAHWFQCKLQ